MIRRLRLQVPGGIYYIVQVGIAQQPSLTADSHVAALERLIAQALKRNESHILAYCWLPHALHLCLHPGVVSVGRALQGVLSGYARLLHVNAGTQGHLFARRHRALLIDPEQWLLPLVRYLHWLPVLEGLAAEPTQYQFSSAHHYASRYQPSWLDTSLPLSKFKSTQGGANSFLDYQQQPPSDSEIKQLLVGNAEDSRILGAQDFIDGLPRSTRVVKTRVTLDQLIQMVAAALGLPPSQLLSKSRQRDLALARAVVAWHATERGIATLSEVASRFRRDPSTLSIVIRRHRQAHPDLFKPDGLHYVVPLG